jgi:RNA polymerase sigma-70 factor (ECF subfamily)
MGAGTERGDCLGGGLRVGSWARLRDQIARVTRRTDEAEDLLHDAWIGMARRENEGGNAPVTNPAAYLARAATNRARDAFRRERHRGASLPLELVDATLADDGPLQDEALIARHRLERLREGVERLSPRTRQIFLLHRLEGHKYREIACDLGISQSAVEKHIAKAMGQLTEWMETW